MQSAQQLNPDATGKTSCTSAHARDRIIEISALILMAILTLIAYSPVLFNFFNGDDFVHLTWLAQAIHHPELVWRNFYTSWLDGTTTKFYRPLISVFMVTDYATWGLNGLGFRLTNIAFHLASSTFIFLIGKQLISGRDAPAIQNSAQETPDKAPTMPERRRLAGSCSSWPLAAATLFALYPLHPEAVSWITGRVDSVVTAFCTAAFYFYLRFSQSTRISFLILSLVSSSLGLLSKEMAITLPAVFLLYELVYSDAWFKTKSISSFIQSILKPSLKTIPFWLLLLAYFGVRYLALHTFVGGYDNSLFFISNMKEFLSGWVHAIVMLLVPINKSVIGSHHILSKLWPAALIASLAATFINLIVEPRNRRHFLFLLGWLVLCLVPVYKLFNIADDLQGSRLAYLATVPLCMILTCALLPLQGNGFKPLLNKISMAIVPVMCLLSGVLLWTNNLPWQMAGKENNAIRASLASLYKNLEGDPQVLFLGLPDQIDGAYTCRNSLDGMTKKPQLDRDLKNCLMVNAFEPIFPFGYLKDSIAENQDKIFFYKWNTESKSFDKLNIGENTTGTARTEWSKERLKEITSVPDQKVEPQVEWPSDGSLVLSASPARHPQFIELDLGTRPCFYTDLVEVNLSLDKAAENESGADLLYSNDMYPTFELKRRTRAYFTPGQTKQRLLFALRGLPEWSLGGNTHKFRFLIPAGYKLAIDSISIAPKENFIPALGFDNSGYFGTKGYVHLAAGEKDAHIDVDASQVPNTEKFGVEITRTNLLFEEQNPQRKSKVEDSFQIHDGSKGSITLHRNDFMSPGLYELRVFPLDKDGTICGAASDHLAVSVD